MYFQDCKADFDGVIVDGGSCALDNILIIRFDNYSPRNMNEGLMVRTRSSGNTLTNDWVIFNGFNPQNCTKDFAFLSESRYRFYGYPNKAPTASAVSYTHL